MLAVITGAHGIAGDVRLKVFADDLSRHRTFNGGALTLAKLRDGTIARFAEVTDRTAAEALRGTELTVPRDALPPRSYSGGGRRCSQSPLSPQPPLPTPTSPSRPVP